MTLLANAIVFALGVVLIWYALLSAVRTTVLPRGAPDPITRAVFGLVRVLFALRLKRVRSAAAADRLLGYYAPVGVLLLLPAWLMLVLLGFLGIYWATDVRPLKDAFAMSGSSLLTLGFFSDFTWFHLILSYIEAILGLVLVALLIAYLPTMYGAFARREAAVTMLDVRAGSPPGVAEMVLRAYRIGKLGNAGMSPLWSDWERLFAEIEESHTSFPALIFFRSPKPLNSWITAAGCVMDSAAFIRSTVDVPRDPQADLCIRAGYLALRSIADFFGVTYNSNPRYPVDPISVAREEYDAVCDELAAQGVPLVADRERAWSDFAGWRVNYDTVLLAVAGMVYAPPAPWSSDRAPRPPLRAIPYLHR